MPYRDAESPLIGDLRFPIVLASRAEYPASDGISDVYTNQRTVFADITPVGTGIFIAGLELDNNSITHRFVIRDIPGLDEFEYVFQDLLLPGGNVRRLFFKVRRVAPWQGMTRFLVIEAQELDFKDL